MQVLALAGLLLTATKCNEGTETIVALVSHECRTLVGQPALLRKTKARTVLQRFELFGRDLRSGRGCDAVHSALCKQRVWCAMPRHGASLREL